MPFAAGTQLGPYEIVALLGEGGMGAVYRARDRKLQRDVALKVLPDLLAADPDRLARFRREAQVLAALNHPHIAHVHGFEDSATSHAIVMELVEGDDLSAHIARGPIAASDAVPIVRQIAEALEAAHDAGVIHRDLKPSNIKVRADGAVKVLDFGLAKNTVEDAERSGGRGGNSLTVTSPALTGIGLILGTAAYMAPEQARGKSVDKRADIWAFGCVLYEMLTGRRAIAGDEITDVLAAVLRQDIDWNALPAGTPLRLRRLLERCLDRDLKTRLRDIGEARIELTKIEAGAPETTIIAPAPSGVGPSRTLSLGWIAAGSIVLVIAGALLGRYVAPSAAASGAAVVRLAFVPPPGLSFEANRNDAVVVSPNGRLLLFSARSADGKRQLYVRTLDGVDATPLPGTEDPVTPFWSPDSASVGFGAQGKLKRVDVAGGVAARVLTDAPRLNGGSWNRAGVIIFVPDYNSGILQISDKGGATTQVLVPDVSRQETALGTPSFLPDGKHFVYAAASRVYLGSLGSTETTRLADGTGPRFVPPDRLLFQQARTLFTVGFDPAGLRLQGDPVPVGLAKDTPGGADAPYSASDNGVLVQKEMFTPDYQLVWFDRKGQQTGAVGAATRLVGEPFAPRLSPDETRVAIQQRSGESTQQGLWVIDLQRALPTRLSTTPGQYPQWSPDGHDIARTFALDGVAGIYRTSATGLGAPEMLVKSGLESGGTAFSNDWSKDGRFILYHTRGAKTRMDLWALPLFSDRKPHPVLDTEFDDGPGVISPDGHWIAYRSDMSGTFEIYVQSFTSDGRAGGERQRISSNGGRQVRFRPDGQELFYIADDDWLMAEPITIRGGQFERTEPKRLFKAHTLPRIVEAQFEYDVTRDGQRFLMGAILDTPNARPPAPTIVINWMAALKK